MPIILICQHLYVSAESTEEGDGRGQCTIKKNVDVFVELGQNPCAFACWQNQCPCAFTRLMGTGHLSTKAE